jgi:Mn2+/Fe2+ NRAMP family transporter
MNAFHVIGGIAAIWAVLVAVVGIRKEDFPGGLEKVVGAISVLIVIATISAALITSANEEDEHGGGAEEATQSESH